MGGNVFWLGGLPEARPACARVKFGIRGEQLRATANAVVFAFGVVVPVFVRKRPFCAVFAGDLILLWGQLCLPLRVCFHDFCHAFSFLLIGGILIV